MTWSFHAQCSAAVRRQKPHPATASGVHFLSAKPVLSTLLRACPVGPQDLVIDFGAGLGAITTPLQRTGAQVIAVERDHEFVRRLRARMSAHDNVRVVQDDVRTVALPQKPYTVISSIPYAASTALLRRMLNPRTSGLRRAAIIVEWGFAKRITARVPRNRELAWWAARFELTLAKRVPADAFTPAPRVDSALITIRPTDRFDPTRSRALWYLLTAAYRQPTSPTQAAVGAALAGRPTAKTLAGCSIDPTAPADTITPRQWASLATVLARDPRMHWPPLPDELAGRHTGRRGRRR